VAWDSGRSARRKKLYEQYKDKGVPPTPIYLPSGEEFNYGEEYLHSRAILHTLLSSLGVRSLVLPGKEGDDVLAHAVDLLPSGHVIIQSEDRDFFQLLSDRLSIYRPIASELVTPETFKVEHGFASDRYLFYKALIGDGSDNIHGIPGVGHTTATKIVQECRDLSEIFTFTEASQNARYRKVALGFDIVLRNMELLDLTREEFTEEENKKIVSAIHSKKPEVDLPGFASMMTKLELNSILENARTWCEPFLTLR